MRVDALIRMRIRRLSHTDNAESGQPFKAGVEVQKRVFIFVKIFFFRKKLRKNFF